MKVNQIVQVEQAEYQWNSTLLYHKGQLEVIIKNNASSVKAITLTVLHYNSKNEYCEGQVQGLTKQLETFTYENESLVSSFDINPNETSTIYVDLHTILKVNLKRYDFDPSLCQGIACVKSVTFMDDSVIDNEYYRLWLEENKVKNIQ